MSAIPLAEAPVLRARSRASLAVRALLAATAAGCTIACIVVSRHPHAQTVVTLPHAASTIVVLDVSASVSTDTYSRIGGTLAAIARSSARIGLVVFSDTAYEALPPGVPASDLTPYVRYFAVPPQSRPGFTPSFPVNPWTTTFTAGTKVSAGLDLAHSIATAQERRPAVVLVSDLDDDPNDVPRLSTVVAAYQRDRVPLRIVGLNPSAQDTTLFQRLLGSGVPIAEAPRLDQVPQRDVVPFPWTLVALALAAAAALAIAAAWAPRLEWGTA
ncbi:MAG: vWA domain-containing protein [Actinomycetota bacterium]